MPDLAPEYIDDVFEETDHLNGGIIDIGDYYLTVNVSRDRILILNKTLPSRLTFATAHPMHNLEIGAPDTFDGNYQGAMAYNGYVYFFNPFRTSGNYFRAFNLVTGVEEAPTTSIVSYYY